MTSRVGESIMTPKKAIGYKGLMHKFIEEGCGRCLSIILQHFSKSGACAHAESLSTRLVSHVAHYSLSNSYKFMIRSCVVAILHNHR